MTAEMAVGLPVLVLLLVVALTGIFAVGQQLRCVDAAREGARAAARGEPDPARFARSVAPAGSTVAVSGGADVVRVEVSVPIRLIDKWSPGLTARGSAIAAREPALGETDAR